MSPRQGAAEPKKGADPKDKAAIKSTLDTGSGWWFGTFFIFPYIGDNNPID